MCINCDMLVRAATANLCSQIDQYLQDVVGGPYGFILVTFPMEQRDALNGTSSNCENIPRVIDQLQRALKEVSDPSAKIAFMEVGEDGETIHTPGHPKDLPN